MQSFCYAHKLMKEELIMLKSLSKSIKSNWKRTLSGLLAVITIIGMLSATALAVEGTSAKAASSIAA